MFVYPHGNTTIATIKALSKTGIANAFLVKAMKENRSEV